MTENTAYEQIIDLMDSLTVPELNKLIRSCENLISAKQESNKKSMVEEFRARAAALGLDLGDVLATLGKTSQSSTAGVKRGEVAPKYAHPQNAAITWSGRGKQPTWFKDALAAGKTADDLLINKPAQGELPVSES